MSIQDRGLTSVPPIWPTLIRLRRTLGVGPKQLAELMELTRSEYDKFALAQTEPSARALLELCRHLHISFDQLMTNEFCYRTVARHFYGDKSSIPEKYTVAGRTNRRVLTNILDFVETSSDYMRRLELMRYLQVNESALDTAASSVNLRCTMEAVGWIERHSRNDKTLERLGREMMLAGRNAPFLSDLKHCRSIYELFDSMFGESGIFYRNIETNFLWRIHKVHAGDKIVIRGQINEEVREQIGDRFVKSRAGTVGRIGMLSAVPRLRGWDFIPVKVTDLFVARDDCYEMELNIAPVVKAIPRTSLSLLH